MKYFKKYKKAFGLNACNLIDFPQKMSNVRISRIRNGERMGCSFCFPHGWETINDRYSKNTRSWKQHRRSQWK